MLSGTIEELEKIKKECRRMSNKRSLLSSAASAVPVPLADIATDVVLLKQIIPAVSEKFGLSKQQIDDYNPQIAIFIYDIAKRLGTNLIGRYITKELIMQVLKKAGVRLTARQAARYVPVVGQAVSAGISYTAMRMIINAHIGQCYKIAKVIIETDRE